MRMPVSGLSMPATRLKKIEARRRSGAVQVCCIRAEPGSTDMLCRFGPAAFSIMQAGHEGAEAAGFRLLLHLGGRHVVPVDGHLQRDHRRRRAAVDQALVQHVVHPLQFALPAQRNRGTSNIAVRLQADAGNMVQLRAARGQRRLQLPWLGAAKAAT